MAEYPLEGGVLSAEWSFTSFANLNIEHAPFVIYLWDVELEVAEAAKAYARKKRFGLNAVWDAALNEGRYPSMDLFGTGLVNFCGKVRAEKAVICDKLEENGIDPTPLVLFAKLKKPKKPYIVLTATWTRPTLVLLSQWYAKAARRALEAK